MNNLVKSIRLNFLYVDKYSFGKKWVYQPSIIPYCMLRYIVDGSALFNIDGKNITVNKGEIIYIPDGCTLSCRANDDNFEFISIRFNSSASLSGVDILTDYYNVSTITQDYDNQIALYFHEILKFAKGTAKSKNFKIRGYLELIIGYLIDATNEYNQEEDSNYDEQFTMEKIIQRAERSNIKSDARMQIVVDYLMINPDKALNTEYLCSLVNLSQTSLRRCFKEHTGKPLNYFIHELRMTTAARAILMSDERISTIAYNLGFDDPNYFSRRFKILFGVSPQKYRKTSRE